MIQHEEAHHTVSQEMVSMDIVSDQQLAHVMDATVQLVDAQLSDDAVVQ